MVATHLHFPGSCGLGVTKVGGGSFMPACPSPIKTVTIGTKRETFPT